MWIKCGDGAHLLNASQVLYFDVAAASDVEREPGADGLSITNATNYGLPDSGVLVIAWMIAGAPVCVGRYETQEQASLVLNTINAAFESKAHTLDVHRMRTGRRGADGG